MRPKIVLLAGLGIVGLLAVGLAVLVATLDFGRFKGPIAAQVERATGRALSFEGEVSLRLFPRPRLSLKDVAVANAPWGSRPHMLRIGTLEAELELGPLLFQRALHVTRFAASEVDLLLERDAAGRGNWEMGAAAGAPADATPSPAGGQGGGAGGGQGGAQGGAQAGAQGGAELRIDAMTLGNVALGWREAPGAEVRSVLVQSLKVTTRPDGRLALEGSAVHREQAIKVAGDVDFPTGFQAPGGPFVGQVAVTLPGAVVKLVGGLADARAGRGLDLTVTGEAEPANALDELLDRALPAVKVALAARLEGDLGGVLRAGELKLSAGRSDVAGAVSLDLSGARPKLAGALEAGRLDLVELLPKRGGEEAGKASGEGRPGGGPRGSGEAAAGDGRLFSAEAFDLSALRTVDADLSLKAGVLAAPAMVLEQVTVRAVLVDGDLAVRPYAFVLAGSQVAGDARVNARGAVPAVVLDVAAQQIDLGRLVEQAGGPANLAARGDLVVALRGAGGSARALAASLDGTASLAVGQGTLKGDWVDAIGLGALRGALPQLQRLEQTRLNCAIARFEVAKGVATAKLIAADAGDLSLVGSGNVNLGTEAVAIDLAPRLKVAIGGVGGGVVIPVQVRGTLLEPAVAVLGGRGQRGNPLAGLGAIVLDPGASRVAPCGALAEGRPGGGAPAPAPGTAARPGLGDVLRLLPR